MKQEQRAKEDEAWDGARKKKQDVRPKRKVTVTAEKVRELAEKKMVSVGLLIKKKRL
ncbi:hypothetical protein ACNKHN_18160 [Shigella flexneri]